MLCVWRLPVLLIQLITCTNVCAKNIALHKEVTLSSTHGQGPGYYATDGETGGDFFLDGCAHTGKGPIRIL